MTKSRGNRDKFGSLECNECEMILTFGPKQKGIKVRCYCMAPHRANKSSFRYDALGVVATLDDARELWRSHVLRGQLTRVHPIDIIDETKGRS